MNIPIEEHTKICPFCAETILTAAIKCRYCGEFFKIERERGARTSGDSRAKCVNHPEAIALSFCRECGEPMCQECTPFLGSVYCLNHMPVKDELPQEPKVRSNGTEDVPGSATFEKAYIPETSNAQREQKENGIAAVLSFLIPGAGQMYKGKVGVGFLWAFGIIFGYMLVIPGIVLHVWCVYSAYNMRAIGRPSLWLPGWYTRRLPRDP